MVQTIGIRMVDEDEGCALDLACGRDEPNVDVHVEESNNTTLILLPGLSLIDGVLYGLLDGFLHIQ